MTPFRGDVYRALLESGAPSYLPGVTSQSSSSSLVLRLGIEAFCHDGRRTTNEYPKKPGAFWVRHETLSRITRKNVKNLNSYELLTPREILKVFMGTRRIGTRSTIPFLAPFLPHPHDHRNQLRHVFPRRHHRTGDTALTQNNRTMGHLGYVLHVVADQDH
jgi:hypothetical protein